MNWTCLPHSSNSLWFTLLLWSFDASILVICCPFKLEEKLARFKWHWFQAEMLIIYGVGWCLIRTIIGFKRWFRFCNCDSNAAVLFLFKNFYCHDDVYYFLSVCPSHILIGWFYTSVILNFLFVSFLPPFSFWKWSMKTFLHYV